MIATVVLEDIMEEGCNDSYCSTVVCYGERM